MPGLAAEMPVESGAVDYSGKLLICKLLQYFVVRL